MPPVKGKAVVDYEKVIRAEAKRKGITYEEAKSLMFPDGLPQEKVVTTENVVGDPVGDVVEGVGDFLEDPTGQKAAAESMAEVYQMQLGQQHQQWDDYMRGFDEMAQTLGGQITPWGSFVEDIRAGEYLPPGADEYAQWDMPQYQREGGQFQDAPAYQVSPGQGYQQWGGQFEDIPAYQTSPYEQYQDWDPASLADDPGYQFRLQQGTEALERRAAAQGRSLGSAADKELMEFAQGLASQEADKAFGRYTGQHGIRRREREFEEPFAYGVHAGEAGRRQGVAEADLGRHLGEFGAGRRVREFEEPWSYNVFSGEQDRLRGGMESDRGFGLTEYATTTPMQYGQFTGERDFRRGADVYGQQQRFAQESSPFEYDRQIQAMKNPLGFMGQQGSAFQGLAGAQAGQHRPALWDWLNLGSNIGQTAGNLGWTPFK